MSLLSVNNLSCSQAIKTLFEDATFTVSETDKIAVIGLNGSGKTTLLNILANAVTTPNEHISVKRGLRLTSMAQNPDLNPEHSIRDHLYGSTSAASKAIREYHKQLEHYSVDQSPDVEKAFSLATEQMDHLKGWEYEDRISSILKELHITQLDQKISSLSGGMRKKIALAQTFFEEVALLILDEPTNHLDILTIEWLQEMLKRQNSAIVMVTHDRYFLDKVCTKIIEIDQQRIFVYNGNYQTYLEQRAQRYAAQEKHESSIQSVLRVELAWLRRGPKARLTKQKARKDRIHNMIDRKIQTTPETLLLNVGARRLGKKVLELKNISKSFGEKRVIRNFSYTFTRGDKIGILGPNGAGKTTLINLISERLAPDTGEIDVGVNTVFGYFDQHSQAFDPELTIYEHVTEIASHFVTHDGATISAAKLLERFLFPSSMLKATIDRLSGGERRRLHLVCLLLENPNFLLFDEPTNDLDIQTLSVLEDFLLNFAGCIIIISHDRYLMDRVVGNLLVFNNNAEIATFEGNYTDYMETLKDIESLAKKQPHTLSLKNSNSETSAKLTNKECEELKQLEITIEELELEKDTLNPTFSNPRGLLKQYSIQSLVK